MQIQHWIGVGALVLTAILSFAAFYERVIAARFAQRDDELKKIWRQVGSINERCIGHMENVGEVGADIRNLIARVTRIENKLDKALNGGSDA